MSLRDLIWRAMDSVPNWFWHYFTWLGDSALMLPAAALIALWLIASEKTRPTGVLWMLFFGAGSAMVLGSKLAFLGWGIGSVRLNFTGFSGHTALAASIWPVALWLVTSRAPHRWRLVAVWLGWALAGAIGVSRLALYAHSMSEVIGGFVIGVAVSASFLAAQHRRPHPRLSWALVALSLATPLAIRAPGNPAPTQGLLEVIAVRLAGIARPYTRQDLLRGDGVARASALALSPADARSGAIPPVTVAKAP